MHLSENLKSIGKSAFEQCNRLTSLSLPDALQTIDDYAFSYCFSLTSLSFPDALQTIGNYAFYECHSLTNLHLPDALQTIGNYAFADCSGVTCVTFSNALKKIGAYAFNGCGLTSVAFPNSLKEIWSYAFRNCPLHENITNISIPGSVIYAGTKIFDNCNLKEVTFEYGEEALPSIDPFIENSVEKIKLNRNVAKLPSTNKNVKFIVIGNNIESVPDNMFKDWTNLSSLSLGSSLKTIGASAFSGCTSLTNVVIPPLVETISVNAFQGDSALRTIIMGHSVKEIGANCFYGCAADTICITAQVPPVATNTAFSNYTGSLYVQGAESMDSYYESFYCWDHFDSYLLSEPESLQYDVESNFIGKQGDTFQLSATLIPENVSLPHIFWRSTNPKIATVDGTGLLTLHTDLAEEESLALYDNRESEVNGCQIIVESLYANGPILTIDVVKKSTTPTEVENLEDENDNVIDYISPIEVYNLNGVYISDSVKDLISGIYIVRQGNKALKIEVK